MIIDRIENIGLYPELAACKDMVTEFVKKQAAEDLPDGTYELDGKNVYALVQHYTPKAKKDARMESHKLYADLQYVAAGEEIISYDVLCDLEVEEDKTPASDIIFYKNDCEKADVVLTAGMFGYYAPQDGHRPKVAIPGKEDVNVTKIVFKIKL